MIGVVPPANGTSRQEKVSQAGLCVDQPYSLWGQMGSSGGEDLDDEQFCFIIGRGVLTVRMGGRPTSLCTAKPKACAMRE